MSDEEKVREAFRLMRRIVEDLGDDGSKIINMMRETEDALREARARIAELEGAVSRLGGAVVVTQRYVADVILDYEAYVDEGYGKELWRDLDARVKEALREGGK